MPHRQKETLSQAVIVSYTPHIRGVRLRLVRGFLSDLPRYILCMSGYILYSYYRPKASLAAWPA